MQLTNSYPGDAAKGGDYIRGTSQQEIIDDPNQPGRRERVIITDALIDFEGRLCFGETTVRMMANLLGMYEGERVNKIVIRSQALEAELEQTRGMLAQAEAARDEARAKVIKVFYANGEPYATEDAARELSKDVQPPQLVETEDQNVTALRLSRLEGEVADLTQQLVDTRQAKADADSRVAMLERTALEHASTIDAISVQRDGALLRLAQVAGSEDPEVAQEAAVSYFDEVNAAQAKADADAAVGVAPADELPPENEPPADPVPPVVAEPLPPVTPDPTVVSNADPAGPADPTLPVVPVEPPVVTPEGDTPDAGTPEGEPQPTNPDEPQPAPEVVDPNPEVTAEANPGVTDPNAEIPAPTGTDPAPAPDDGPPTEEHPAATPDGDTGSGADVPDPGAETTTPAANQ